MLEALLLVFAFGTFSLALTQAVESRTYDARRRDACPQCGYGLDGLSDIGVCPECRHSYSLLPVWKSRWVPRWDRLSSVGILVLGPCGLSYLLGGFVMASHAQAETARRGVSFHKALWIAEQDLSWSGTLIWGPALFGVSTLLLLAMRRVKHTRAAASFAGCAAAAILTTAVTCLYILLFPGRPWSADSFARLSPLAVIVALIGAGLGWALHRWRTAARYGWGVED